MSTYMLSIQDNRLYAGISICGKLYSALLDSGANMSIAGEEGVKMLLALGLNVDAHITSSVKTADKTPHPIIGSMPLYHTKARHE